MNKIQSWTIVFLLAVLTLAVCWHIYRQDINRQNSFSLERQRLSIEQSRLSIEQHVNNWPPLPPLGGKTTYDAIREQNERGATSSLPNNPSEKQ